MTAGIFFSYPRDGHFKFLPAKYDKWYFVDYVNWVMKNPDKWQHYYGNYATAVLIRDKIGLIPTLSLMTVLNVAKEVEDAYREGFSMKDLEIGTIGLLAGAFHQKLACYYDTEKILVIYYFDIDKLH
ncbi:MAG: hypothetical protein CO189_11540 [candidate division Zixibacteria bacterium CG_4_9_14_3_um_filter_46_8]|nr:MAG: hypothetical protein CO189_11540 [candidate division Zixibacteria bacterium CG_4_9_14_3_um_filter_46_8]